MFIESFFKSLQKGKKINKKGKTKFWLFLSLLNKKLLFCMFLIVVRYKFFTIRLRPIKGSYKQLRIKSDVDR